MSDGAPSGVQPPPPPPPRSDRRSLAEGALGADRERGSELRSSATGRDEAPWLVLGEAIWDLFGPRVGQSIRARRVDVRHPGGAGANIARGLARLGVAVDLLAAVGDDDLGAALVDDLHRAGVGIGAIARVPARTGLVFVEVMATGTRRFLPYRQASADMGLSPEHLTQVPIERAPWIVVDGSGVAREATRAATRDVVERCRGRLAVDLNLRPRLWDDAPSARRAISELLERADVVKASEEDLAVLDAFGEDAAASAAEGTMGSFLALHRRRSTSLGPSALTVLTLAERGAIAAWGASTRGREAVPVALVDPTGAGDAFTAGLLATLGTLAPDALTPDSEALDRAMAVGCAMGSRAVGRLGASTYLRALPRDLRRLLG